MYHTEYLSLDILTYSEEDRYKFLMGTVIPRPIALVTSLNEDGVLNAAPFSQFVVISVSPPLLAFVAKERTDGLKDTVRNVLASGEFVINTVTERMAEQVQQCSNDYPPPVSEVELVGFHPIPSSIVRPSRIAESPVQFECRLHRTVEFGKLGSQANLCVGEVLLVHYAEGVVSGHRVKHEMMNALGRIAGRSYIRTRDRLDV
jgi:flavin reductase (DIM6/NTAB) family NADH-FMN oxidoreductase RutF